MTLKEQVQLILQSWPEARDDEGMLLSSIWSNQLEDKKIKVSGQKTFEFMSMLMDGTLDSASAILATRDDLQRNNENLTGDAYADTVGNIYPDEF